MTAARCERSSAARSAGTWYSSAEDFFRGVPSNFWYEYDRWPSAAELRQRAMEERRGEAEPEPEPAQTAVATAEHPRSKKRKRKRRR